MLNMHEWLHQAGCPVESLLGFPAARVLGRRQAAPGGHRTDGHSCERHRPSPVKPAPYHPYADFRVAPGISHPFLGHLCFPRHCTSSNDPLRTQGLSCCLPRALGHAHVTFPKPGTDRTPWRPTSSRTAMGERGAMGVLSTLLLVDHDPRRLSESPGLVKQGLEPPLCRNLST